MRSLRYLLALLILCLCMGTPATAQYLPSNDSGDNTTESLLDYQDRLVFTQFRYYYPRDFRFDRALEKISLVFNAHGEEVFSDYNKEVYFVVFVSSLGFNAISFHKLVIFDSLLLDSLRHLADGIAVYGDTDNDYCRALALTVARIGVAHQFGVLLGNYTDRQNPYQLPVFQRLTSEQKQRADRLFEDMLAAVMAHEASHAFLNHVKEKMETSRTLWQNNQDRIDPRELNQYITNYINYTMSYQKELEADSFGARLMKASGYEKEGFIYWFQFSRLLEEILDVHENSTRTHPTAEVRIENINKVWDENSSSNSIELDRSGGYMDIGKPAEYHR